MEFTFSDDQDALRATVRAFLAKESPPEYVRAMLEDEVAISDHVWNQLVELGWTGLLVPEAQGGLGLGLVDLIVVLEEMGQVPFPGPFLSSAVFATLAARLAAHNPQAPLERGYALVTAADGTLLRSASNTQSGAEINVRFAEDGLRAKVI